MTTDKKLEQRAKLPTPPSTGVTERGFEEWLHKQVEYIALTDVHGDVVARCVTSLIRKTWNAALASREEK